MKHGHFYLEINPTEDQGSWDHKLASFLGGNPCLFGQTKGYTIYTGLIQVFCHIKSFEVSEPKSELVNISIEHLLQTRRVKRT